MKNRGFTLIELLIVVALIGILAIALLSAINPIEQAKKARDSGRKSDAAELLNAFERYNTTYDCYPWNGSGGVPKPCANYQLAAGAASRLLPAGFQTGGVAYNLISTNEIKVQFPGRSTISKSEMWVSEATEVNGPVSVCFEPESASWRAGGGGTARNNINTSNATCSGTYGGGSCYVCVPQ